MELTSEPIQISFTQTTTGTSQPPLVNLIPPPFDSQYYTNLLIEYRTWGWCSNWPCLLNVHSIREKYGYSLFSAGVIIWQYTSARITQTHTLSHQTLLLYEMTIFIVSDEVLW